MKARTAIILLSASALAWTGSGGLPWADGPTAYRLVPHASAQPKASRQPLYYQAPSGAPDYSATPRKDLQGRDYVPVYDDPAPRAAAATPPAPARQILYYQDPSGAADFSPTPREGFAGTRLRPGLCGHGAAGGIGARSCTTGCPWPHPLLPQPHGPA